MKKIMLLLLFGSLMLFAKDYALIVGISNYQNISGLSHIDSDIATYKRILGYRGVNDVKILRDSNATRGAITSYLNNIVREMQRDKNRNNRFFMFFAGHGINTRDVEYGSKIQENGLAKYLTNSGVVLPYEFNPKDIANTIIIGKRDLRPYLVEIDRYVRDSLIIFDACYSENSIKGGKIRDTPFVYSKSKDYPYKNIVYIASATSRNKAKSGVLSKVLDSCLIQLINLNQLRVCMNNKLMYIGQRVVISK